MIDFKNNKKSNIQHFTVTLEDQYKRLLFTVQFLLNGIGKLKDEDERVIVEGYTRILNNYCGNGITPFYLKNIKYGIEEILRKKYSFDLTDSFILSDFILFLENFCATANKNIPLYNNFFNLFDEYSKSNDPHLIEKFYEYLFLNIIPPCISFYQLSLFKSFILEHFKNFSYINYIDALFTSIYIKDLFNSISCTVNSTNEIDEAQLESIVGVFSNYYYLFNGLISNNFINPENLDLVIYLIVRLVAVTDKWVYIDPSEVNEVIFILVSSINHLENKKIKMLVAFMRKNFKFSCDYSSQQSKVIANNIDKELFHHFGSFEKVKYPFFDSSYELIYNIRLTEKTDPKSGVIYSFIPKNALPTENLCDTPFSLCSSSDYEVSKGQSK